MGRFGWGVGFPSKAAWVSYFTRSLSALTVILLRQNGALECCGRSNRRFAGRKHLSFRGALGMDYLAGAIGNDRSQGFPLEGHQRKL